MDSWHDYLQLTVILPSAAWLLAMIVGIHSLWSPGITGRRRIAVFVYIAITATITVAYEVHDVQLFRDSREVTKKINTLLALEGVSSDNSNQGLDKLITRNLQPRSIIPTQEEVLTRALELIKASLPKTIHINYLANSPDWVQLVLPIQRALGRNNIDGEIGNQRPSSARQTGLMFTMPDPTNPPDFALPLKTAFETAGIYNIGFVRMNPEDLSVGFTIFVGPAPLQSESPPP